MFVLKSMQKYARSSSTITSYSVASSPMIASSCSSRQIHAGLLGLEYIIAAMSPPFSMLSSLALSALPLYLNMSNSTQSAPIILNCDFCIGKPGSMNSTLFFPGMRCVHAMKEPNEPATLPVVGTHERSDISMSRNALTKRDASCFSSGIPAAAGYCDPTPRSRAAFSASTPNWLTGKPGEP